MSEYEKMRAQFDALKEQERAALRAELTRGIAARLRARATSESITAHRSDSGLTKADRCLYAAEVLTEIAHRLGDDAATIERDAPAEPDLAALLAAERAAYLAIVQSVPRGPAKDAWLLTRIRLDRALGPSDTKETP